MFFASLKRITAYVLICFLLTLFYIDNLQAFPKEPAYAILDYNSGTLLDGENVNTHMQPASLTKLMTLYIVFEYLEQNKIKLSTRLKVSKKASSMPPSKIWLKAGQVITIKDAINAMIVKSANDVAYTVAENLGHGSEAAFINLMNQKAKELGLKNTYFKTANGLTAEGQYSTAYDLAILARGLMLNHSKYYYLFSQKTFKWHNYSYRSTNHLLDYNNIDGLKTGYTFAAGFNIVTSTEINGVRVIVASLGNTSSQQRDVVVKQLTNSGVVIAQNFRFSHIAYKEPPQEVIAANNLMSKEAAGKVANLINNNQQVDNKEQLQQTLAVNNNIETTNPTVTDLITSNSSSVATDVKTAAYIDDTAKANKEEEYKAIPAAATNEVANNKHASTSNKNYYVQIGVYSSLKNAQKAVKEALSLEPILKQAHLTINTINNKKKEATLYRVRLNNLSNSQANTACLSLKNNKLGCFVNLN